MLNFKTYLSESTGFSLNIRMKFQINGNFDSTFGAEQSIKKALSKNGIDNLLYLSFYSVPTINFDFLFLHKSFSLNQNEVNELSSKVLKILSEVFLTHNIDLKQNYVSCNTREELPDNLDINVDSFSLYPLSDITLTNIHKKVNCSTFYLSGTKVTGHVLGLLKIKDLKDLFLSAGPEDPRWFDIIEKHIKTKDILACHEELVDNGLEDYAQL